MTRPIEVLSAIALVLLAQDHKVEPTWLHRDVSALREHRTDLTTNSCHYTPIFGEGDVEAQLPQSIARFGELAVDPRGACQPVEYPRQEELYFVREGSGVLRYGEESHTLRPNDFAYLSPTVRHSVSNTSDQPLRIVITTVRIASDTSISPPAKLVVANLDELKEQTVEGHPRSVQYKLLIGPRTPDAIVSMRRTPSPTFS
jgi:mannose-6-phosphate isomerase-like protein (cupin superfamily)